MQRLRKVERIGAKPFWSVRVYAIDAKDSPWNISRHSATLSRTTKPHPIVASFFLGARVLRVAPLPDDPAEIADLNRPDGDVGEEEMAVLHRAQVEERVPGHWGISRDASMARRAFS